MLVVIDPGHGGSDPGAVYNGRQEKDDVLRLGKTVGQLLEDRGVDVVYTREGDIYETPFKKAQDGNAVGADYFVSIHRNSSEYPNQYSGAEVLVYSDSGVRRELANNILEGMEKAGLKNLGIGERKDLVVLRRTQMPAVLVEAGFINSDKDNENFDRSFDELAQGIANGILQTLGLPVYTSSPSATADRGGYGEGRTVMPVDGIPPMNGMPPAEGMLPVDGMQNNGGGTGTPYSRRVYDEPGYGVRGEERFYDESAEIYEEPGTRSCSCQCPDVLYRVQVGAYRNKDNADRMLNSLLVEEFPAFIVYDDGIYKVQVGAYRNLSNAIAMENKLRQYRYNTYITTR